MPKSESAEIVINGSHGEGGGSLFRTALAVSALTQQPLRIHHIRGGVRKHGITPEDLTMVRALEVMCDAALEGDELDSNEMSFKPKHTPKPLKQHFDVQSHEQGASPGNALMLSQSPPVLARTGGYTNCTISGETYNPNTLTFDAFQRATLALHAKQGVFASCSQTQAGFGFAGLGTVQLEVEPSAPNGISWITKGGVVEVQAIFAYADIHEDILERGDRELKKQAKATGVDIEIEHIEVNSKISGLHLTLTARYETGLGTANIIGTRGMRVERLVDTAWERLLEYMASPASLDPFLADQALVIAAFASGSTTYTTELVTPRLQTIAWVIRQFMPIQLTIHGRTGESGKVAIVR